MAEVFSNLFGDAPVESLPLFAENPYRRKNLNSVNNKNANQKSHKKRSLEEAYELPLGLNSSASPSKKKASIPKTSDEKDASSKKEKKKETSENASLSETPAPSNATNKKKGSKKKATVPNPDVKPTEITPAPSSQTKPNTEANEEETEPPVHESLLKKKKSSKKNEEDVSVQTTQKSKQDDSDDDEIHVSKKRKPFDASKLPQTVFVGNLPKGIKKKLIEKLFSTYGKVESVRLRSVPIGETKLPRKIAVATGKLDETRKSCNAFVVFESEESATFSLKLNMTEFHGHHIRVDRASVLQKGEKVNKLNYDKNRSIFLGNLPLDVEEEELYELFKDDAKKQNIEAIRIVRDPKTNIGKGIAFLLFKNKVFARKALFKKLSVREREVRIKPLVDQNSKNGPKGNHSDKFGPRSSSRAPEAKGGYLPFEGVRANKGSTNVSASYAYNRRVNGLAGNKNNSAKKSKRYKSFEARRK